MSTSLFLALFPWSMSVALPALEPARPLPVAAVAPAPLDAAVPDAAVPDAAVPDESGARLVRPRSDADDVATARARADALEAAGDLDAARAAWLDLVPQLPVGLERDALVARTRRLDARLRLREELVSARTRDARVFAELGLEAADAAGVRLAGASVPWSKVPFDVLERASAAARASRDARNGLVYEKLARGSDDERRAALVELGRRLEKSEIDVVDAHAAVAHARGETVPARGYAFDARKGTWTSVDEAESKAAAQDLEALANRLVSTPAAERDKAWAALAALGPDVRERVDRALAARFEETCRALAKGGLDRIEAVANARRVLDERRTKALALIFDEDAYFYPYRPPECPPEKAKDYPAVQQRVDALVADVREAWKSPRKSSVSPALRAALEDWDWNRARQKERKLAFPVPATLPSWLDGLDRRADSVDVRTFAWDARERAALTKNDLVQARNRRLWSSKTPAAGTNLTGEDLARAVPSKDEQDQVDVTNEYRLMMGRCALAWNPRLQSSAQMHSDYMANTGEFSHFEKDPARARPGDRMRLVGYLTGVSENCHMGGDGPEGAHVGWQHSSGHHRNLLYETHREMASASAGDYWTQNFGVGVEFEKDLAPTKP